MFTALQNPLSLIGRVLIALLFIPAGFSKIGGFAGTVGYIASKGVPLPEVAAAIAIAVGIFRARNSEITSESRDVRPCLVNLSRPSRSSSKGSAPAK